MPRLAQKHARIKAKSYFTKNLRALNSTPMQSNPSERIYHKAFMIALVELLMLEEHNDIDLDILRAHIQNEEYKNNIDEENIMTDDMKNNFKKFNNDYLNDEFVILTKETAIENIWNRFENKKNSWSNYFLQRLGL